MIFGKIEDLKFYKGTSKNLDLAIEAIESGKYLEGKAGRNEILGDDVYFNIQDVETRNPEDAFFETHDRYADIHVVLEGNEQIGYALNEDLENDKPYNAENDFATQKGEPAQVFVMKKGTFILFFPNEPHMPLMALESPEKIKKAVFKIKY